MCMKSDSNSHSTMRVIRLLTEGGILLLAMQRYAPICSRDMSCRGLCDILMDGIKYPASLLLLPQDTL